MLGGYGKPMAIMISAVLVPFYAAFLFAALFAPQYLVVAVAAGLIGMVLGLMGIFFYTYTKFQGMMALGLTRRLPEGEDVFDTVVYDSVSELPRKENFYRYAVVDSEGKQWVFLLDHPWGELSFATDEVLIGSWIAKIPICYVDGVQIGRATQYLSVFERPEPTWLDRILRRELECEEEVPIVYLHSTNKTAEKIFAKTYNLTAPSPDDIADAYRQYHIHDTRDVVTKAGVLEDVVKKQEELLEMKGGLEIEYTVPQMEEEKPDWKAIVKWVIIMAAVVTVFYAVYHFVFRII
jgi:hypothetical protein